MRVSSSAKAFFEVVDVFIEEFSWGVRSLRASPFMRPFLTPWGLQEEKCVYWKVSVGLKCVRMSRIPWLWNIDSRLKQVFVFFRPPEVVNFRLKSLLETTFAQSKQICSFDDGDTHTRSIDLVGVESILSAIEVKDSQMKPEIPNASHATPHFWREMQMETHQARQVDLSRLRRSRSAASRPNEACSARQEVDKYEV